MSNRYKGGIISATPPTTTGGNDGVASGAWTLEQQMQAQAAGLWPNQPVFYIEDVFSTWLYVGNGSTQTITNGIDLAGKGGLAWIKNRSTSADHLLYDTIRGANRRLATNTTNGTGFEANQLNSFTSTGFTLGSDGATNAPNRNTEAYTSWTFREQPKFFDVVTWTGSNDVGTNTGKGIIPHNLGSVPGCVIIKNVTQGSTNWIVYHRSLSGGFRVLLNTTDAQTNSGSVAYFSRYVDMLGWVQTNPDANNIYVGYNFQTNGVGDTIVAYVFAHNAGGFGLSGTDNVISCGSFTTDGSGNATVSLGYEPQFWLYKPVGTGGWTIYDTMRGWSQTSIFNLNPNTSGAEGGGSATAFYPTATGFDCVGGNLNPSAAYIYIAIRRGPMRTPTTGTSVFQPTTTANGTIQSSVPVKDAVLNFALASPAGWQMVDRLRGIVAGYLSNTSGATAANPFLVTNSTAAESASGSRVGGLGIARSIATAGTWFNGDTGVIANGGFDTAYFFQRSPSFFDVVCYTGSGTTTTQAHNLQAVPELIIVKRRNGAASWVVYSATYGRNFYAFLDLTQGFASDPGNAWGTTNPTSTTFSLSPLTETNASGSTYVAYLFASVPGVSKVGTYTGTGTTQTINCGFTGGARFVMIKRGDSTGGWHVWDTARGMIPANDPYLLLNSTAAEVTGTDFVDTAATGFEITSTAPAAINANGGTFIFLAIA